MQARLNSLDWVVLAAYFAVIFGIAWFASRRKQVRESADAYFLASRNVDWFLIGASLFATNMGAELVVGLSGSGADIGIATAQLEVLAALMLLLLGWVFVPFYLRSGVVTMPEFLERRYSPAARWYLAVISIAAYVLTKVSVAIAAGGIIFESLVGIGFWQGALLVIAASGIYTVIGGLRAVIYTQFIQAIVLVGGSLTVLFIGLNAVGGWGELTRSVQPTALSLWRPMTDPDFPWTGVLLGGPIVGIWYWCTDQYIVQRVLSARNIHEARRGAIFAGFLKLTPLFIFVLPGVVAAVLASRGVIRLTDPDEAWPALVGTLLPGGLRGLVAAGAIGAVMSALASSFNSSATLITWDIYRKLRPQASERRLVLVGQATTVVLVLLSLAWIPMIENVSATLYKYLQSVQSYIAPPITAVFLLGLFWKRLNATGAIASLIVGFILGAGRLIAELSREQLGGLLRVYAEINFLHFALFLFVVCAAVLVLGSFASPPPDEERLAGLTFATVGKEEPVDPAEQRRDLILSLLLAAAVGLIWIWFS